MCDETQVLHLHAIEFMCTLADATLSVIIVGWCIDDQSIGLSDSGV